MRICHSDWLEGRPATVRDAVETDGRLGLWLTQGVVSPWSRTGRGSATNKRSVSRSVGRFGATCSFRRRRRCRSRSQGSFIGDFPAVVAERDRLSRSFLFRTPELSRSNARELERQRDGCELHCAQHQVSDVELSLEDRMEGNLRCDREQRSRDDELAALSDQEQ